MLEIGSWNYRQKCIKHVENKIKAKDKHELKDTNEKNESKSSNLKKYHACTSALHQK